MSHGRKHSIGFINKRCWRRSDSDVDPFIFLGIRNNKIDSIVRIPRLVLKIKNSGVRKVQPERILAKRPPLKAIAFLRSIFICLETDVELRFIIYARSDPYIFYYVEDTYSLT